jgi:hypothetical protein
MQAKEKDGSKRRTDDIYSQSLRAGNRTYFFDVKSTKSDDLYLTITESKRRFNNDNGKFFYEKHKLFLYPEDFKDFCDYLNSTLDKIKEMKGGEEIERRSEQSFEDENETKENHVSDHDTEKEEATEFSNVSFEDLGK